MKNTSAHYLLRLNVGYLRCEALCIFPGSYNRQVWEISTCAPLLQQQKTPGDAGG
jgi:hypothetical protein